MKHLNSNGFSALLRISTPNTVLTNIQTTKVPYHLSYKYRNEIKVPEEDFQSYNQREEHVNDNLHSGITGCICTSQCQYIWKCRGCGNLLGRQALPC